jgi:rubrerythrin
MTMEMQILMDKLSEFLAVEQGGAQLYRIAGERAQNNELKQMYQRFGEETMRHRDVLIDLIGKLGGDPNYISPSARIAMHKAESMLGWAHLAGPLTPWEVQLIDLENIVLAETKDLSDWTLLETLGEELDDGEVRQAIQAAVDEVLPDEDEHLRTVTEEYARMEVETVMRGTPPQTRMSLINEQIDFEKIHPKPIEQGLLEFAGASRFVPPPVAVATGSVPQEKGNSRGSRGRRG